MYGVRGEMPNEDDQGSAVIAAAYYQIKALRCGRCKGYLKRVA